MFGWAFLPGDGDASPCPGERERERERVGDPGASSKQATGERDGTADRMLKARISSLEPEL